MEKEKEKEKSRLVSEDTVSYGAASHATTPNPNALSHRRSAWHHTTCLLLAEVVGTGVLALAEDMTKLGWVLGLSFLAVCLLLNYAAGVFLWRIQQWFPNVTTYADVAGLLFGYREQIALRVMLVVTLFLVMSNYLLVLSLAIQDVLYKSDLCQTTATLIALAVLLVPSQQRSLHYISFTSLASVVCVLAVLGVCMSRILDKCGDPYDNIPVTTSVISGPNISFMHAVSGISSFVFATGGQMIYLEMIAEMKEPSEFPKSLRASLGFMASLYLVVAVAGYHCLGISAPPYLIDVLPNGLRRQISSVFMAFHVVVSYTLHQQVLTRKLHVFYGHNIRHHTSIVNHVETHHKHFAESQLQWFCLSLFVGGIACLVANLVPFFSDLVSIIGSTAQSMLFYFFPAVFYWRAARVQGVRLSRTDIITAIILGIFACFVTIFGTYSNISEIAKKWQTYSSPFSCVKRDSI